MKAVCFVSSPTLYHLEHLYVEVDCSFGIFEGRTSVDVYKLSGKKPNCFVATKVNAEGFWKKMLKSLELANKYSPMNK